MTESGKGFQLGVVNICNNNDSITPLGIVNIVKGGYYAFELTENDILMTNLSYKMGVEKLHAVFRVGLGRYREKSTFSYGFGLGSIMSVKGNHKINIELVCNNLNYDGEWKINTESHMFYSKGHRCVKSVKCGRHINKYRCAFCMQ